MMSSLLDQHTVDAVVLSCIDFRFDDHWRGMVRQSFGIRTLDSVQLPGGAQNLASPYSDAERTVVLRSIGVAIQLHNPQMVILLNHQQCGAYAQTGKTFSGLSDERAFHSEELKRAAQLVQRVFPGATVRAAFISVANGDRVTLEVVPLGGTSKTVS